MISPVSSIQFSAERAPAAGSTIGPSTRSAGVAPVILVLRVAGPLLGEAVAADVADAAVDDRYLAVVAIVHAPEVGEGERVEANEADAGIEHQLLQLLVHLVAARGVDQQAHFDALPRFRRQRVARSASQIAPFHQMYDST